jgi:hypothetical protein
MATNLLSHGFPLSKIEKSKQFIDNHSIGFFSPRSYMTYIIKK